MPLSVSQQLGGALALSPDLAALNAGLNAFLLPSITMICLLRLVIPLLFGDLNQMVLLIIQH